MKTFTKLLSLFAVVCGFVSLQSSFAAADPVRMRVEVDRPLLPCGSKERVVLKVCLDGLRTPVDPGKRAPVNVCLVLDRSGSMSGDKIEKAKEAAIEVIRRLSPRDLFSLVTYNGSVQTLIPTRHVRDAAELEEIVSDIRATGGTALYGGVAKGAEALRRAPSFNRYSSRVILLSDGEANVGPSSPAELAALGRSLAREDITVSTIGLGLGYNEDLMTRLAGSSDGNTYFAKDSSDLERIFNAELGDVLDIVARKVIVEVRFPKYVRPLRFVGREGVIRDGRAEFSLNQLYGGQAKYALIEVELEPGDDNTERDLAEASLSYDDALTLRTNSVAVKGQVRFTSNHAALPSAVNVAVQTDYAMNRIAESRQQAIELADAGRNAEAAAVMQNAAEEVVVLSAFSVSAVDEAKRMRKDADEVKSKGLSNSKRKAYKAESYQTVNQQSGK